MIRLALAGAIGLAAPWSVSGVPYDASLPFTYLFDTGASAPEPLSGKALAEKTGWTLVGEDLLEHEFQGDAVLLNDKLLIALRWKGPGAEVYTRTGSGWKSRAVLMSLSAGSTAVTGVSELQIVQNDPAAVMLRVEFTTSGSGGNCQCAFRLTTGRRTVQVQPGTAADRLFVWCRPRWVVVPDFFGDDMIFGPQSIGPQSLEGQSLGSRSQGISRTGLPTENIFLNLVRGGDAMIMGVWPSGRQASYAIAGGDGPDRTLLGTEVQAVQNEPLWVAFFEGENLWHEETVAENARPEQVALDFKPPFAAQWRADLVQPDGFALSFSPAASDDSAGEDVSHARAGLSGNAGADRADPRPSVAGELPTPQLPTPQLPTSQLPTPQRNLVPLVIYPLDRTRETPLTAFCPTDVIRSTLGVGPCQYILQTEGLATQSNPTPDQVMTWVERQFERGKQIEAADEIGELLQQMVQHVGRVQTRIGKYRDLAERIRPIFAAGGEEQPTISAGAAGVGRSLARLERILAAGNPAVEPGRRARELAAAVVDLAGRPNSLEACRKLGDELRNIGAVQDVTLSKCRMTVRWLQRQAAALAAHDPNRAETAQKLDAACRRLLQNP